LGGQPLFSKQRGSVRHTALVFALRANCWRARVAARAAVTTHVMFGVVTRALLLPPRRHRHRRRRLRRHRRRQGRLLPRRPARHHTFFFLWTTACQRPPTPHPCCMRSTTMSALPAIMCSARRTWLGSCLRRKVVARTRFPLQAVFLETPSPWALLFRAACTHCAWLNGHSQVVGARRSPLTLGTTLT